VTFEAQPKQTTKGMSMLTQHTDHQSITSRFPNLFLDAMIASFMVTVTAIAFATALVISC
jgi:hypothetical protein